MINTILIYYIKVNNDNWFAPNCLTKHINYYERIYRKDKDVRSKVQLPD